jgi:glycosyltransferase involved in cell wall biosynthesis
MQRSPRIHFLAAGDVVRSVGTRSFLRQFLGHLERQGFDVHVHFFQFRHDGMCDNGNGPVPVPDFLYRVHCPASEAAFRQWPRPLFRLYERTFLFRYIRRSLQSIHPGEPLILHGVLGWAHLFHRLMQRSPLWWLKLGVIEEEQERGPRFQARKKIEHMHARRFGRRLVVSSRLGSYLTEQYGPSPRGTFVIPCLVDAERFNASMTARAEARGRLGFEGRVVFLYSGIAAPWQCIPETVAFFERLRRQIPQALLWVLTPDQDALKPHLSGLPPACVRMEYMPHERLAESLAAADFGFLLRKRCLINRVASPVKFLEYLASGVPVVVGPEVGDYSEMVRADRLGVVLDPESPGQWGSAIDEVAAILKLNGVHRGRYVETAGALSWQFYRERLLQEFMPVQRNHEVGGSGEDRR